MIIAVAATRVGMFHTWGGRVYKHSCLSPIQLVEDGIQRWMAQVNSVIIGFNRNAVGVQDINGVGNFFQRAFRMGKRE